MLKLQPEHAKRIQTIILGSFAAFFAVQLLLLSPGNLEEESNMIRSLLKADLTQFLQANDIPTLRDHVPTSTAPSYSLRTLTTYMTGADSGKIQINAKYALSYSNEQIIYAKDIQLQFFDHAKPTLVTANEGVIHTKTKKIDLYGNVIVTLDDGSWTNSDRVIITSDQGKHIHIPVQYPVTGGKNLDDQRNIHYSANGADYYEQTTMMFLRSNTVVNFEEPVLDENKRPMIKKTTVYSDFAEIDRNKSEVRFDMSKSQPIEKQFVRSEQKDLFMQSRKLRASFPNGKTLESIIGDKDINLLDTRDPSSITRATSGHVIIYNSSNRIELTEYPQVYQNNDTITGEKIVLDRNLDIIEMEQSNARNHR